VYPSVRGEGGGWESPGDIGLREGSVEICFVGMVCALCWVEGVEQFPVFGADIEGEGMIGSIVPRATTYWDCRWVLVGGVGRKMAWSCPPVGGFP